METSKTILLVSSIIVWLILLSNLIIILGLIKKVNTGNEKISDSWLRPGSLAPNFKASDLQNSAVTLDTFKGKSVLFAFVRPSCRSCGTLIPKLAKVSEEIKLNGTALVLVCMADWETAKGFTEQYSISLPVIVASRHDNPFIQDYKVGATPFYCLIDKNRKVKEVGYFAPEWNTQKKQWTFNAFSNQELKAKFSLKES